MCGFNKLLFIGAYTNHKPHLNLMEINMADCGCGRSPTGKCMGWHALTEEQYQEKKAAYEAKKADK